MPLTHEAQVWVEQASTLSAEAMDAIDEQVTELVHDQCHAPHRGEHIATSTVRCVLATDRLAQAELKKPNQHELQIMLGLFFADHGISPLQSIQVTNAFLATLDRAGYKVVLA